MLIVFLVYKPYPSQFFTKIWIKGTQIGSNMPSALGLVTGATALLKKSVKVNLRRPPPSSIGAFFKRKGVFFWDSLPLRNLLCCPSSQTGQCHLKCTSSHALTPWRQAPPVSITCILYFAFWVLYFVFCVFCMLYFIFCTVDAFWILYFVFCILWFYFVSYISCFIFCDGSF